MKLDPHLETRNGTFETKIRKVALQIKDVARAAGVSHQTVSRVVNNHPNVSELTRARVLSAITELNYHPNLTARNLRTGEKTTILVLAPEPMDYGSLMALEGVEATARRAGLFLLLRGFQVGTPSRAIEQKLLELSGQSLVGAIILDLQLHETALERLSLGVPVVTLTDRNGSGHAWERRGVALGVEHLVQQGHRRIGYLSGPNGRLVSDAMKAGWHQAMEAAGLDSSAVIEGDLSAQSGYITGCDLARSRELTGVVAANDQMALGLLNGLQVNGIHIPQEMSVVGLNDQPGAKYFSPPLTTVRPDLAALGSICAEVLISAGPHQVTGQTTPQSILIVRDSSGPPARNPTGS
ncbi:LacI family DNA-binding transcriptional regulator [Arthrobacter sp. SIMBA_036]|uniref:LacI family DNA-binding transcriptional regulator n=1 Tax=Arthrobacter sp. SIMBA_036 TaxID=3085778 RepID=UPI00397CA08B